MTTLKRKNMVKKAEKENKLLVYSAATKHLFSKRDQELFEKLNNRELLTDKFLIKQKNQVIAATQLAFETTPKPSIKEVLIDILTEQSDTLPPSNMLQVATYVTEEWQRLEKEKMSRTEEVAQH